MAATKEEVESLGRKISKACREAREIYEKLVALDSGETARKDMADKLQHSLIKSSEKMDKAVEAKTGPKDKKGKATKSVKGKKPREKSLEGWQVESAEEEDPDAKYYT